MNNKDADPGLAKAMANASRALDTLLRFAAAADDTNELERAGLIQAFEFTFETTWKLLQKYGAHQGLLVNSPKQAMAVAIQLNLYDDEEILLNMLEHRDLTTHTYNPELAATIAAAIRALYLPALRDIIAHTVPR